MTEIETKCTEIRMGIEKDIASLYTDSIWGPKANAKVIEMGVKFCKELLKCMDACNDEEFSSKMHYFSDVVVRVLVAGTRYYEEISEEELKAIGGIFNELRGLRDEYIRDRDFNVIFEKSMYIREIFLTNAVGRKDDDGKYRQSMIFPNFCDLYEIVHKILSNWDKLTKSGDFCLMFVYFRKIWYHTEINSDYHGDLFLDKVHGWNGEKPETAKQGSDPRYYAREFLDMLDEKIND